MGEMLELGNGFKLRYQKGLNKELNIEFNDAVDVDFSIKTLSDFLRGYGFKAVPLECDCGHRNCNCD